MSNVFKGKLLGVVVGASLIGAAIFAKTAFSAVPVLEGADFEGAEVVEFESVFYTYPPSPFKVKQAEKLGKELELVTEPSIRLTGYLAKPEGEGLFPAIVFMHGCEGIWKATEVWSDRLVAWGYVVLSVDSLTPRGEKYICGRITAANNWVRVLNAYGAKRYLSARPFVDPTRIAVMGMGYGGQTLLHIIKHSTSTSLDMRPFRAAVAFYPICDEPEQIDTPTLVLIGSADHRGAWAENCVRYLDRLPPPHEMTLKVFPGAHHVFDHPGLDLEDQGHIIRSDPDAAAEANLAEGEDYGPGNPAWDALIDRYVEEMRDRQDAIRDLRRRHQAGEVITLLCTCHEAARCHRSTLAGFILDPARYGFPP